MQKNIAICLIVLSILTVANYAHAETSTTSYDATYWEAKKVETQNKSTQVRKEYYEKYKAKGYDVSSLTSDILDGSKTDEGRFWDALKKIQNQHEMTGRLEYVAKLKSKGIDVSGFTDTIMNDSGKFWELANRLYKEYELQSKITADSNKEQELKTKKEYEQKYLEAKKEQEKQYLEMKKEQENKAKEQTKKYLETKKEQVVKPSTPAIENIKKLFTQSLDKIPADKQSEAFARIEKNILKQIEITKKRNAKLVLQKLEAMLIILQERMETTDNDESIINDVLTY